VPERRARSIGEYRVGDRAIVRRRFTVEDVRAFATLSGDENELHLDAEYAVATRFGRPIVHGALTLSLISRLIGMDLPGRGAVYLSQTAQFRRPIYPGDEVEAAVEVTQIDAERRRLTLSTTVTGSGGEIAMSGEALVMVDVGS
jgi:acyl dehydratase